MPITFFKIHNRVTTLRYGGEPDGEILELYIHALETGALDKCLGHLLDEQGETKTTEVVLPSLPAALALHAVTHAVLEHTGVAGAAVVLRRLLRRPNTGAVLRGLMNTPLTQRRRPAVARVAAVGAGGGGATRGGVGGGEHDARRRSEDDARRRSEGDVRRRSIGHAPFGPGAAYGCYAPVDAVEARRAVMLGACSDDAQLRRELRDALEAAVPYPPDSDSD